MDELKDFTQHLRSIHFAMVLTAGAILLGLSSSSSLYETALVQLRDINRLSEQLTAESLTEALPTGDAPPSDTATTVSLTELVEETLYEYLEALDLANQFEHFHFYAYEYLDDPNYEAELPEYFHWFERHTLLLFDGKKAYPNAGHWMYHQGQLLAEQREYVDRFLQVDKVLRNPIFDPGYLVEGSKIAEINRPAEHTLSQLDLNQVTRLTASLQALIITDEASRSDYRNSQQILEEDPIGYERFSGSFDLLKLKLSLYPVEHPDALNGNLSLTLHLPFMFEVHEFTWINALLAELDSSAQVSPRYQNGLRSSAELFPELFQVTELLASASYADLERYLLAQQQQNNAPLNLFGLSIDSQLIGLWGVVVLVFIQLYFAMHYHNLVKLMAQHARFHYPWIGLYRDHLSRLLFQLSLLLPTGVTLSMAIIHGVGGYGFRVALVVIALLTLALIERDYLRSQRMRASVS